MNNKERRHKTYIKRRLAEIEKVRQWQMDNPIKVAEYKWKFNKANPMAYRYYYLKHKHKERVQITQDDFILWYKNEPKKCFYCDIPEDLLTINNNLNRKSHNLFTIDRENPNGVYEQGNIVLACGLCNLVKSNYFTVEEMRLIAQRYIKPKWQKVAGIEPEIYQEALAKEAGYVKLAEDQSLPQNPYPADYTELPAEFQGETPTCEDVYLMTSNGVEKGFRLMLKAGFHRIEQ